MNFNIHNPKQTALRIKTGPSATRCKKCTANARSANPKQPPMHQNCKCSYMKKVGNKTM